MPRRKQSLIAAELIDERLEFIGKPEWQWHSCWSDLDSGLSLSVVKLLNCLVLSSYMIVSAGKDGMMQLQS